VVRRLIPNDGGFNLQHLRRFAKYECVPQPVRTALAARYTGLDATSVVESVQDLVLLLGPADVISQLELEEALSAQIGQTSICTIQVPRLAPTSHDQAFLWSSKYWPVVYKKNNPFGPHPSILLRATEEIRGDVVEWMNLAHDIARASSKSGIGEAIGVVIVNRKDGDARPVAVAGDARWLNWPLDGPGNATAHAVLRAIAMVSEGLRAEGGERGGMLSVTPASGTSIFCDQPLVNLERDHNDPSYDGKGYLCNGLEIYCSHEPCVMCSMAIVHSRFSKVVFRHRMPTTGGLCADGKVRHGLFWRKELNWILLAWQWISSGDVLKSSHDMSELHA